MLTHSVDCEHVSILCTCGGFTRLRISDRVRPGHTGGTVYFRHMATPRRHSISVKWPQAHFSLHRPATHTHAARSVHHSPPPRETQPWCQTPHQDEQALCSTHTRCGPGANGRRCAHFTPPARPRGAPSRPPDNFLEASLRTIPDRKLPPRRPFLNPYISYGNPHILATHTGVHSRCIFCAPAAPSPSKSLHFL